MLQQRMNVFVKTCEQSDARINFVVARKRGAKLNISALEASAMFIRTTR